MLGKVDLSKLLQDNDLWGICYNSYTGIYDKSSPQTFDDARTLFKDQFNIDLKSFQQGVLFADVSQSNDGGNYWGAIVKGTFNKNDLIAAIRSWGGDNTAWRTINYKDYHIYAYKAEENVFAFLSDNTLVIGTMQPVKDVIDAHKGDVAALGGEVLDTYNKLGDTLIKVAVAVPPNITGGELGESASKYLGDLSEFDKVKSVGMTVSKNDQSVALNVKLYCADIDSAQSVEDSINGLIIFLGLMMSVSDNPEENQALSSLLEKTDVNKSGSYVDVRLEIALSNIEELVKGSTDGLYRSFIEGFMEVFPGTSDADNYKTDEQVVQLAAAAFYSDVHSGWWDVNGDDDKNNASSFDDNVWCDSDTNNTQIVLGHYYPTAIAKVSNHVLTLSTSQFDPDNLGNPRIDARGVAATDAMIQSHAIWMGLLVNNAGDYTGAGGTTDRWKVSPLDGGYSLYLNNVPESAAADVNYNGDPGMVIGGSYCWVVGTNGCVYGVYMGSNGYWYAGFNGIYP